MPSFLARILESRRHVVENAAPHRAELVARARDAFPPRDFADALRREGMSLIAEVKRRSPSKGDLDLSLDPGALAYAYEAGGARAISVLTEPEFFAGSAEDLERARNTVSLPVLWKDFVIDPIQVVAARASGADAVLLITRILDDAQLRRLLDDLAEWKMSALVEVFDERDLERTLQAGVDIVGINHRDLETFAEDPSATSRLRPLVPDHVVLVAESAITQRAHVEALEAIGVHAMLVGEALVTAPDPSAKIRELLGS